MQQIPENLNMTLRLTVTLKFKFPLIHPSKIIVNNFYDQLCEDKIYSKSLKNRLSWLLKFIYQRKNLRNFN